MRKALILGTNAGQADIIEYLKDNDWYVHSCGYKAIGPGVELADEFHLINTTDIDKVVELANKIDADIVYSVSSDTNITAATKASEILGLPFLVGSEIIELFNRKNDFRSFLNKHDIGTVNFITTNANDNNWKKWNDFPCVVKPIDSQGQRGVQLVNAKEELEGAVLEASKWSGNGEVLIEEFLDGAEVSTNVIVQNGEILINEFTDRIVFENDFFGLPKGHGVPVSYFNEEQLSLAKSFVEKIVLNLNIKDAVLYIQMKLLKGAPKVIEIAPRLDGCHIWRLLKHYRGYDLRDLAIRCLLKEPIDKCSLFNDEEISSLLEFYHLGTQEKFSKDKLNIHCEVSHEEFRYNEGDSITPINGRLEVVGYCVYNK